jgi:Camelysin metallo-endopeptidase
VTKYNHSTATKKERSYGKIAVAGLLTMSVGLLAAAGVYAGLSATATGAESVTSGSLDLTLSPDVGAGFSNFTGKMAPGDTDNVYVDLNNTGSLASAAGMTLSVAGAPANALTNGSVAGEGLTVTATQCSVAWTLATGVCSGTTTSILPTTQVSSLATATALSNIPALVAATGQVAHVQVSLGLVATETSTNGIAPAQTIQGLSTTLTYTFTELQRAGVATNQ